MTAYRSLNKLERKAHMSIHEKLEVAEEEFVEPSYTRDRFGKRQNVNADNGSHRKIAGVLFILVIFTEVLDR